LEEWTRIETAAREVLLYGPYRDNQPEDLQGVGGFAEEWAEDIGSGSWDAIIALTVSRLPNLEVLKFEDGSMGMTDIRSTPSFHISWVQ
jgi:hypothetical protein